MRGGENHEYELSDRDWHLFELRAVFMVVEITHRRITQSFGYEEII